MKTEIGQTVMVEFRRSNNMGETTVTKEIAKSLATKILALPINKRPGSWKTAKLVETFKDIKLELDLDDEKEEPKKRGPKPKQTEE